MTGIRTHDFHAPEIEFMLLTIDFDRALLARKAFCTLWNMTGKVYGAIESHSQRRPRDTQSYAAKVSKIHINHLKFSGFV